MNKTKEAIEALLSRIEDDIAYFDTGKDDMRSIDYEFGNLEIRVTDLYTLRATLKAVLASLPDEGELAFIETQASTALKDYYREHGVPVGFEGAKFVTRFIAERYTLLPTRALQQRLEKEIGDE